MSFSAYQKDTTDASFELLKKFLDFMGQKGIQIVVVGGWAIEAYQPGIGSKDIDIVMQTDEEVDKLLSENFFDEDIYQIQQIYPIQRKKTITVSGTKRTILCDIFCAKYYKDDYGRMGIKIHWGLAEEFKESHEIRGIPVLVPKRELLIIFKIIAAIDRSARLDRKRGEDDDEDLESKIWKDYRDVAFLAANQKLDKDFLRKHMTESHLLPHMERFLSRYKQKDNKQVLDELGITPADMELALKV